MILERSVEAWYFLRIECVGRNIPQQRGFWRQRQEVGFSFGGLAPDKIESLEMEIRREDEEERDEQTDASDPSHKCAVGIQ
jgi:hypothetical protein